MVRKLSWLLLALCVGCGPTPQSETLTASAPADSATVPPPAPAVVPDGFLDPAWFRVARLDTFRVRVRPGAEGGFDLGTAQLVKLTAGQEKRYLQGKPRRRAEREAAPYYFYSLQLNTPQRQEITVLQDDGEYLFTLLRLVYNARHQLISRKEVAYFGADGGEMTNAYGRFESPAQFRLTAVQEVSTGEDSLTATSNIDSTVTLYTVVHDQFRQLSQQKYQRQKVQPLPQE